MIHSHIEKKINDINSHDCSDVHFLLLSLKISPVKEIITTYHQTPHHPAQTTIDHVALQKKTWWDENSVVTCGESDSQRQYFIVFLCLHQKMWNDQFTSSRYCGEACRMSCFRIADPSAELYSTTITIKLRVFRSTLDWCWTTHRVCI